MFFRLFTSVFCGLLLMVFPIIHAMAKPAVTQTIAGYWKTIDDHDQKPRAIIHVWKNDHGDYAGKIIQTFLRPGESKTDVCDKCAGKRHNQSIVGMTILWGLTSKNGNYSGGHILDPKNGSIYHCNMVLTDNKQALRVRGYIGIPLFGRTQTWQRVQHR